MFFSRSEYKKLKSPAITAADLGGSRTVVNPDGSRIDVEDSTLLSVLDKEHIVANIRNRFNRDCIYTFTASVLLAVNPYKHVSGLYSHETQMTYTNRSLHWLPPHPYALADTAYRYFFGETKSQVLVVSGESGSGKTETAKTVISFLASHRERRRAKNESDGIFENNDNDLSPVSAAAVYDKVINATPILEAFGNASTIRNRNSSRFGKYHRLLYERAGKLAGADIKPFLLESSRVTGVSKNERNFHVFYQVLAGMSEEELKSYRLSKAGVYPLIANGLKRDVSQTKEDSYKFEELVASMDAVGFSEMDKKAVFSVIAGLLVLSQVEFLEAQTDAPNAAEEVAKPVNITNFSQMEDSAALLGFETSQLTKVLINKTVKVSNRNSAYSVPRSVAQVEATRATLIRTIYKRLFERLVLKINALVGELGGAHMGEAHIGILDIFGFENLTTNSFEQLCINLTNEKLQEFFIRKVLESEQKVYAAEGIQSSSVSVLKIPLPDCSETLGAIRGALELLDDHCIRLCRNLATDEDKYCQQVLSQFKGHAKLVPPKFMKATKNDGGKVATRDKKSDGFTVKHYAGDVMYSTAGWLEKNNERMSPEMECLLRDSGRNWVAQLADPEACSYGCEKFKSVRTKFTAELDSMLSMLEKCYVHYVRCFNPNPMQKADQFDLQYVTEQVVQCGTVELVNVMHHGFPNRQPLKLIAEKYQSLLPYDFHSLNARDLTSVIMHAFEIPPTEYAIGFTTLFLKADQIRLLEQLKGCGELPSSAILSVIRRQVSGKKLRRCLNAVKLALWFPKLLRQIRRKNLFMAGARLAVTLSWIIPRARACLGRARETIHLRRIEEERERERERVERERERVEAERKEAERVEAERMEAERVERERQRVRKVEEERVAEQKRIEEEKQKAERMAEERRAVHSGKNRWDTATVPQLIAGKENLGGTNVSGNFFYPPAAYGKTTSSNLAAGNSMARLPPVTALMMRHVALFSIDTADVVLISDGRKLLPLAAGDSEGSRRSSIAQPSIVPPAIRSCQIGAIAQHPFQSDVFATAEIDEVGSVTIWRAGVGVESRFRIHLGSGSSTSPENTLIQRICFIAPDSPETVSPIAVSNSYLLAVLVECSTAASTAQYLIFLEVGIGGGSSSSSRRESGTRRSSGGANETVSSLFRVHKVEPIPPSAFISNANRSVSFVKTSASGRIVAIGGRGLLMFFAVGMESGQIQVDLLADQTYFPQIQTTNFLSLISLFAQEEEARDPDFYQEEQILVSSADGNMLRFPILVNRATCALDISGCGKVKECISALAAKRITGLVKKSNAAFLSVTADGCIDQWVWAQRRPFRDQDSSIALVSESSKALFSYSAMLNREVVCFDASAGKVVAFDPSDPDSLNPRLLYQFAGHGLI